MFGKLLLLFILVPTAELYLFIKIGSRLGLGPTLAIIIVTAVLGASLTK
ncbi:MAG: FxsA family protein, partial [Akkermansiaceae bacterium]